MVVEPKIAITRIMVNINLAVQNGFAIHIILYVCGKFWKNLILI